MTDDFCYIHGYEPMPPQYYRICGECWHVYVTPEELVQKDLYQRASVSLPVEPMKAEDITICPECLHDF